MLTSEVLFCVFIWCDYKKQFRVINNTIINTLGYLDVFYF